MAGNLTHKASGWAFESVQALHALALATQYLCQTVWGISYTC